MMLAFVESAAGFGFHELQVFPDPRAGRNSTSGEQCGTSGIVEPEVRNAAKSAGEAPLRRHRQEDAQAVGVFGPDFECFFPARVMGFQFGNLRFAQSQAALLGPPGLDVFDTARSLGPLARGVSQFFSRTPMIPCS